MVVTIFLDPENPHWSTTEHLRNLENGEYGPFYGPSRWLPSKDWREDFPVRRKKPVK